jgi:hypothetical protein
MVKAGGGLPGNSRVKPKMEMTDAAEAIGKIPGVVDVNNGIVLAGTLCRLRLTGLRPLSKG